MRKSTKPCPAKRPAPAERAAVDPRAHRHARLPRFHRQDATGRIASIERYLHADLLRLTKAKNDKNRDVRWAWEADEAKQLADNTMAKAQREPAGPRHETLMKQAETVRWMLEEFYVSLWAQELGTPKPISLQRIKKAIA